MTRVAVVIPAFNDGPIIADAVTSICEDAPVEVVVVDDGSTDRTTLIALDALREQGVNVIRQANGGPGVARMTGVAATRAPFVFPLDADDLLVPGALGRLADLLDRHPDAGFAWGDYEIFGDYDGRYRSPSEFLPWTLTYVDPYPISSMIRRDALERTGGWPARDYEDWSLWLAFVGHGIGGVGLPEVIYRRRLENGGRAIVGDRSRHREIYAELKVRHAHVFARRRELRHQENPPSWKRLVWPVLFGERVVVPFWVEAWMQRTLMRRAMVLSR